MRLPWVTRPGPAVAYPRPLVAPGMLSGLNNGVVGILRGSQSRCFTCSDRRWSPVLRRPESHAVQRPVGVAERPSASGHRRSCSRPREGAEAKVKSCRPVHIRRPYDLFAGVAGSRVVRPGRPELNEVRPRIFVRHQTRSPGAASCGPEKPLSPMARCRIPSACPQPATLFSSGDR